MSHTPYAETLVNTYTTASQSPGAVLSLSDGGWVVIWNSYGQDGDGYGVYQQVYNADGTAQGGEVPVNTHTTGDQYSISATSLSDGGWVVKWESVGQDGDGRGVYLQRYDAEGVAVGEEVPVNSYTTGDQSDSTLTALSGGGWVVTWDSAGQDGDSDGIFQQRYNADGIKSGGETQVNTYTTGYQVDPQIAALAGGGWVVAWTSQNQDGSGQGVFQQAYHADGTTDGGETQVNTYTTGDQSGNVSLTALADGGWVVNWNSNGQDGSGYGLYQQRYNADDEAVGGEVQVNTTTAGYQYQTGSGLTTALAGGGWVVTWLSGVGNDFYQRAYDADGTALGGETHVNTTSPTTGLRPENVIALSDGGWVQVWMSYGPDGDGYGVYQQAYNADGTAEGSEIRVNTYTTGNQFIASAAALDDGGWVVSWYSVGQDGDGGGVYQQRYDAEGQVYGTNHAPTAADGTIAELKNGSYTFSKSTFGFSDGTDGDHLASVTMTALPSAGKLLLDGDAVTDGETISASDLAHLVWQAGRHARSVSIGFTVTDNGGTAEGGKDTSAAHTLTFAITSDTFTGTKAADKLVGTDGHDILNGMHGDDKLTGGRANDTFVFKTGDGQDTITDFDHKQGDKIDLSGLDGVASYKDLVKNHLSGGDHMVTISDGDGDTITLLHTSVGDLHKGDFLF